LLLQELLWSFITFVEIEKACNIPSSPAPSKVHQLTYVELDISDVTFILLSLVFLRLRGVFMTRRYTNTRLPSTIATTTSITREITRSFSSMLYLVVWTWGTQNSAGVYQWSHPRTYLPSVGAPSAQHSWARRQGVHAVHCTMWFSGRVLLRV